MKGTALPWPREQIERLPWRRRAVVILIIHDHMTIERVAWLLGIATASVERDLREALAVLGK